jgi:polysaccharide export outer membrane protein
METTTPVPAPLAAVDPSKGGPVAFPEPPPEVPSTTPLATDPLRLEEERLSATKSYRIGPEDVLHVSVWDNPELTIDVTVRPDGKISFPLIKEIQAADFTPMELSDVISRNLKEYIKDPRVTVIVTQTNSRKIFLVGNVLRPGSFLLRHDMTVLQALSLAGGFTQFASPRNMKLIRDVGGKQESRSINYYKMIKGTEVDDYMLKPGDTIVIP